MANTWTNVSREDAGFSLTLISLSPVQFMCSKMVSGPVRLATCAIVGIAVSVMATSAAARMGTAVKTLMGGGKVFHDVYSKVTGSRDPIRCALEKKGKFSNGPLPKEYLRC